MNPTTITILTFAAVAGAVVAVCSLIYDLFLRRRMAVQQRLNEEFRGADRTAPQKSPLFKDLKLLASETGQAKKGSWRRFEEVVEQSGLPVTARRLITYSAAAGSAAGAAGAALTGSPAAALFLLAAGAAAPVLVVLGARMRRINNLLTQLPEAFEMMSRAIKSGQTVSGAFQVVARDFASPLKEEFAYCHEQQCLGLPQDVALRELARRTSVMELQMLVVAILVQRQSGGNPVLLLENLASVVRKRLRLKTKVKALTGEGRMQALVLLLLPPLLLAAIYFLNRSYAEKLLEHPELLWGMAGSEAVGAFCIWKILNFGY